MQPLIFITNDVSENYPAALVRNGFKYTFTDYEDADGLLIPGGGDIAPCLYGKVEKNCRGVDIMLDNFELYMAERFILENKPIMGICRGFQLLNVLFGGTLCQHFDGHYGDEDVKTNCRFFGKLKDICGENAAVLCRHHQKIDRLGDRIEVLAISEDGCKEAFSRKNVFAVQFHPERMTDTALRGDLFFDYFKSYFD